MSNRSIKKPILAPDRIRLIVVDSFCGCGGFTEGVEQAVTADGYRVAVVVAGINHDAEAIVAHAANHPETAHFVEDVRDAMLPSRLVAVVNQARLFYPNARLLFHASLECTNFSNAKGGKPRDADSRSLAEFMPAYLTALQPDIFTVENVREFMGWGPLTAEGKPENRKRGKDYVRWYQGIEAMGYRYDYRLHNCADFGANTSRTRYFAQFVRPGMPLVFPQQTHAKNPVRGNLFSPSLQKWRPIRECLDLTDKGKSIFRNPPLSEKTYERIFEGLVKHVGNGDKSFISKYFTGHGKHYSLDDAAHTVTVIDHNALVTVEPFAMTYNSGSPQNRVKSLDEPAQTLLTENTIALVSPEFVMQPSVFCMKYHSNGDNTFPVEQPCSTLLTKDGVAVVSAKEFISLYYSSGQTDQSADSPAAALTTIPKHRLVSAAFITQRNTGDIETRNSSLDAPAKTLTTTGGNLELVQAFTTNAQWFGQSGSIEEPCQTIVARQDKCPISLVSPQYVMNTNYNNIGNGINDAANTITADRHWMYLISAEGADEFAIVVHESDGHWVRQIKAFMAEYGLVDVLMRMLKVPELKRIQGFPASYILTGSQTQQKKFIGNSIVPIYAKVWMEAIGQALSQLVTLATV